MPKQLVVASRNRKKIQEIRDIMEDAGCLVISQQEACGDMEVVEDGETFEENAYKKAFEIMKATGQMVLADDSGLEVDALGGKPGVLSARFAGEGASDDDNNRKLLGMMADIPADRRKARFVCAAAVVFPDAGYFTVRGECEGEILFQPRGTGGFGYDPLFFVPEYRKTFAELEPDFKNSISHRAKALSKVKMRLMGIIKEDGS